MTNPHPKVSPTDIAVASDDNAGFDARAWAAGRLRFEHLLGSLERQAGLVCAAVRSPRP